MDNLRNLQLTELRILKELIPLFEKEHITWFALGGTMLGAVRHQGFIPWDDDIDIGVPREDYERLREVCKNLPEHIRIRGFREDTTYNYYFDRVEDDRIHVTSNRAEKDEITAAWIDIFPLDGMPNGAFRRKTHGWAILYRRMLFQIARFDEIVNTKRKNRPLYEKILIWGCKHLGLQKIISRERTFRNLDRTLKRSPYATSDYNVNAMGAYKLREVVDKKIFGDGAMYPFEDIQIRGAVDFEAYLTQLYGDWRTPADFSHHSVVDVQENMNAKTGA